MTSPANPGPFLPRVNLRCAELRGIVAELEDALSEGDDHPDDVRGVVEHLSHLVNEAAAELGSVAEAVDRGEGLG